MSGRILAVGIAATLTVASGMYSIKHEAFSKATTVTYTGCMLDDNRAMKVTQRGEEFRFQLPPGFLVAGESYEVSPGMPLLSYTIPARAPSPDIAQLIGQFTRGELPEGCTPKREYSILPFRSSQ